MTTRSELLEWFYRRGSGANYQILSQDFEGDVDEALQGLIDLGIVFEYTQQDAGAKKKRMFKVKAKWSKGLELNSGQGGYRLGKFKTSNGGSSNAIREYVKTAAFKYVLVHR